MSKMRRLTTSLDSLREELRGIMETETQMEEVMKHVDVLDRILRESKRVKMSFSNASKTELENLDVKSGELVFDSDRLQELLDESKKSNLELFKDLLSRLVKIYQRVNMDYEVGAPMVLDAILLFLGDIVAARFPNRAIVIIPEMKPHDAAFKNGAYEVTFGGSLDYAIIEYEKDKGGDKQARLVGPDSATEAYVYRAAAGHLFLVEAKHQVGGGGLKAFIPEAVTQAMVILSNSRRDIIHFCLSDGQRFIFFVLTLENGRYTFYQSTTRELTRPGTSDSDDQLHIVVRLLLEWLSPTKSINLYTLESD